MRADVTVIILTYNEELNLPQALNSVIGWANQIIILDSFSTDRTIEIARDYGCEVYQNKFENYSKQRNYALQLPIRSEWVLFLDADEWITEELKKEISEVISAKGSYDGFYIKMKLIWMGRWIKHGYYPSWILRLFRYGKGKCEERGVNEHIILNGTVGFLKKDFIHEDRKGITDWIDKHNRYANREAEELIKIKLKVKQEEIPAKFFGSPAERKRWLRKNVLERMPPLIRPFFYFGYRYFLCGGFLDGREAFIYHFFQGLWYHFLIDVKYLELKNKSKIR